VNVDAVAVVPVYDRVYVDVDVDVDARPGW
jgi:hypothetical protein